MNKTSLLTLLIAGCATLPPTSAEQIARDYLTSKGAKMAYISCITDQSIDPRSEFVLKQRALYQRTREDMAALSVSEAQRVIPQEHGNFIVQRTDGEIVRVSGIKTIDIILDSASTGNVVYCAYSFPPARVSVERRR